MTPLDTVVLPVAGLGSRFLPATKSVPKEMLPVVDKPLIAYAVEEAFRSGMRNFVFVTSRHKKSLEDYFDDHPEMQAELVAAQKADLLEVLGQTRPRSCSFFFVRQTEPRGTGDAVWRAAPYLQGRSFAVMFPDELVLDGSAPGLQQLVKAHALSQGRCVLGVMPVQDTSAYGIVAPGKEQGPGLWSAQGIVEKPKLNPPSNLAVVGRYVFNGRFLAHLQRIQDRVHGREVYLTDAIETACLENDVVAQEMDARRFDCGSKQGYLQASVSVALGSPALGADFERFLRDTLASR